MTLEKMINKKKRGPNKWQIFLKGCMPNQSKDLPMTDKVSACGIQYRELKEKNPKELEKIVNDIKLKNLEAKIDKGEK